MKRVISLSVFDSDKHSYRPVYYWQHLRHSIWGYLNLFPDWEIWIYHDSSLYNNYYGGVLLHLQEQGLVKLFYMGEEDRLGKAMLWRLNPIFDEEVEYVLCRDVDHSPTIRERTMAEQFIKSGKALHCIQDNPAHSVYMMGGLISFECRQARNIIVEKSLDDLLDAHEYNDLKLRDHGTDQTFMKERLWEAFKGHSAIHSNRKTISSIPKRLPNVAPTNEIDKCIPFMGTARCDFDKWHEELKKVGHSENSKIIREAEDRAFVDPRCTNANLELANMNVNRVILGCDGSETYYFFMPIVTLLWQHYMGYCPVIMIVGNLQDWLDDPRKRLVLNESRKLGAEINFIPEINGYKSPTVAQNSRMFVSCLPLYSDEMYILTSDMDMLPLNEPWFNSYDKDKSVQLYYANAYKHKQYPLCYVGAKVKTWRDVMNPFDIKDITESIAYQFNSDDLKRETNSMKVWCYDEKMFGDKLKAWSGYPDSCQMIDRKGGPPVDRIDRSAWPIRFDIDKIVDCHCLRPAHVSPNWEKVCDVLSEVLTEDDLELIVEYRNEFISEKS